MDTLRWGIAGPGRIAETIATEFAEITNGTLTAVGSRSAERAAEFAHRHSIEHAYGSYDELIASPEVDAIYLATPHGQHTDIALAAIAAGKHLLIEKAFTATVADTELIIDAARQRGVFVMEAMWTRFIPAVVRARELIAAGAIGDVRAVQGDLFAYRRYDPADRLFNPELGGGVVLDLGVYVISFAQYFLGTPDSVHTVGGTFENGVDAEAAILLGYDDGRFASGAFSFRTPGPGRQVITGTEGWIEVHPRFHHSEAITLHRRGAEPVEEHLPHRGRGNCYEFEHVADCIKDGLTESPVMPLADTLTVQKIMADVLRQLGR